MNNQYVSKKSTPEVVQDFNYRSRRIIKEIFGCDGVNHADSLPLSDIICLQEVDKFAEVYQPEFDKHGYNYQLHYRRD